MSFEDWTTATAHLLNEWAFAFDVGDYYAESRRRRLLLLMLDHAPAT